MKAKVASIKEETVPPCAAGGFAAVVLIDRVEAEVVHGTAHAVDFIIHIGGDNR